MVRNPDKRWWKLLTPRYIAQEVKEWVDDFEEEDVYMTVKDFKTVTKDVLEERVEKNEKFSIKTSDIQTKLTSVLRRSLEDGLKNATDYACKEVNSLKKQFKEQFDRLDQAIKEKYKELAKWSEQKKVSQEELVENQKILDWLNDNIDEINEILNI